MANLTNLYLEQAEKRKQFGIWIAQIREKSGFDSQRQLALVADVSPTTISRIESGLQKAEPDTLEKLSRYLQIPYTELMAKAGYPIVAIKNGGHSVPLLGPIKAGVPILSEDNYTETITPPKGVQADFAAPVEGDSMRYAGIFPGDIAFFKACQEPIPGHIVAARVLDIDAAVNLKYYIKKNGHAVLRSANPEYPDIPFTENHVVVGIMTGLIRDWAPDVHDYENAIVLKEKLDDQWREAVMQAIADGISPKEFSSLVTMMKKFLKG